MKAVRLTRNLIVAIALAVSLGTNAMLFVGGVLYSFVDKFVEEAFDLATAAGKQRKAMTALKTGSAKADTMPLSDAPGHTRAKPLKSNTKIQFTTYDSNSQKGLATSAQPLESLQDKGSAPV